MNTIWSIIIGLLGISVMVLVHEFGHFFAAKLFHVNVEVVSFGFGPPLFKWGKKRTYQIGILPFGGFCKMKGEDDLKRALATKSKYVENAEPGSLYSASPLKRLVLYLFGPLFNLVFSFLCFFILLSMPVNTSAAPVQIVLASDYPAIFADANPSPAQAGLYTGQIIETVNGQSVTVYSEFETILKGLKGETVVLTSGGEEYFVESRNGVYGISKFIEPLVATVAKGSMEGRAGLKSGDRIVEINSKPVSNMFDILQVRKEDPRQVVMKIIRNGREMEIVYQNQETEGNSILFNFTLQEKGKLVAPRSLGEAMIGAIDKTSTVFGDGFNAIIGIFSGRNSISDSVAGTLGASSSIGELTTAGFSESFSKGLRIALYLLAGVSTSIAIANLLPIPSLDGGLMLLSFVELIKGKNATARLYIVCQVCGLLLVLALVLILNFVK